MRASRTLEPPRPVSPGAPGVREAALRVFDAVAAAPVGIAVLDRELRFLHVNRWIAEVSGLAPEEHLGRTPRELFPAVQEPIATIEERVREVLQTGAPSTCSVVFGPGGDCARREAIVTCFAVLGDRGDVGGACAVVVDVTEDREREAVHARARAEAERLARRVVYLQDVVAARSATTDPATVAQLVVERARQLVGAISATFRLVRGGALELLAASTHPEVSPPPRSVPLAARLPETDALAHGEPVWLESREAIDARFPEAVPARDPTAALAVLPLGLHPGPIGTLAFAFDRPRAFDPEDRAIFVGIADQAAQAVERVLLHAGERAAREAAQRATERLTWLLEITAALSASRTPAEIAATVTERVHAVVGAAVSACYALEADGSHLRLLGSRGASAALARRLARVAVDAPLPVCRAASTGVPVWQEIEEPHEGAASARRTRRRGAVAALPLRASGRVVGALGLAFDRLPRFDAAERSFLLAVAEHCGIALERARLLEDERRAREEADRARGEADRARALLDALVEAAPLGIGFFDRQLRFQHVNPSLARMNGLPVAAHVGRTPREVLPGMPMDDVEAAWRRVLETGEPVVDVEVRGETPAGPGRRGVWVESWYPVRAGSETIGVGALVRDVTKEREAEEFQRHVEGVVGHDLRNPLSAIVMATSLLERLELPAPARRLVARVGTSAARVEEIVRALLDYASVRGGAGVPLERRPCDLAEIVRAVADECALARPGRQVRCDGEPGCAGEWDADRIGQLLTNLVSNALEHAPRDAPVRVRWRPAGDDVVLEVANAGPPIPPEIVPRLFEPFQRGEGCSRGGLGLGLFIARAIARAHGGGIEVRSSPGEGTVFSVRLPRR